MKRCPTLVCSLLFVGIFLAQSADWPQWRADSGRTASTPDTIPEELHTQWIRKFPPLKPAFRDERLQFDNGYEPVIKDGRLFIASSREDSLTALDIQTGKTLWEVFTDGPNRFAPVVWQNRVFIGSDDGHLYCFDTTNGALHWKFQAVPSDRKLLGNGRLISVWPVRGGPVLHHDKVYFAAGVWSFEGVFVYALDAKSGEQLWLNDQTGHLYGVHPHNAEAFGGLAPQGYLLIDGQDLIVPCSSAYPARFDLQTGKLKEFQLPAPGRKPGGWFVATDGSTPASKLGLLPESEVDQRRQLLFDRSISRKRHEDRMREEGREGIRSSITTANRTVRFDESFPGIKEGSVHTAVTANSKLFVVTKDGQLHCFGNEPSSSLPVEPDTNLPVKPETEFVSNLLDLTKARRGQALWFNPENATQLAHLATKTELTTNGILDSSTASMDELRSYLNRADLYGHRVSLRHAPMFKAPFPSYIADLVILQNFEPPLELFETILDSVRPFGGQLILQRTKQNDALLKTASREGFHLAESEAFATLTRHSLPGSCNYAGDWSLSQDQLVQAPLGVLWFDDTLGHFKRSPQPKFIDGIMISSSKEWLDASTRVGKVDYRLQPNVFSDAYTGRILADDEVPQLRQSFSEIDLETVQPNQYRPPTQVHHWKPDQPESGTRINPLTNLREPRRFPKSYGCDGGFDYGNLYTLRSGTAAFYDKRLESGTISISGPRSGCTNSIIPANGILNVPYFFEGCTCSYPLPTALALISLPETHEQWSSWGTVHREVLHGKIRRLGLNFGAPGDRNTRDGTLWLDVPNVGGPSPELDITVSPQQSIHYHYRHSVWIKDQTEAAWPWVCASTLTGAETIQIAGLLPGSFQVRLYFAELEGNEERRFSVGVNGLYIREAFSPLVEGGQLFRGTVLEMANIASEDDTLTIHLNPISGDTCISGIELIRVDG
ncbi:MAG: PQQ-binding-like beta-propeller repeat protein [Verrucomicrobiota bacterium]